MDYIFCARVKICLQCEFAIYSKWRLLLVMNISIFADKCPVIRWYNCDDNCGYACFLLWNISGSNRDWATGLIVDEWWGFLREFELFLQFVRTAIRQSLFVCEFEYESLRVCIYISTRVCISCQLSLSSECRLDDRVRVVVEVDTRGQYSLGLLCSLIVASLCLLSMLVVLKF